MAVTVQLATGESADDTRIDADYFFVLTKWDEHLQSAHIVLTLRASDVVWAEVSTERHAPARRVLGAAALHHTEH